MFYVAVLIRELASVGWKNRESVELGGDGLEITIGPISVVQLESTFSSVCFNNCLPGWLGEK